jgi:hypothetical protein
MPPASRNSSVPSSNDRPFASTWKGSYCCRPGAIKTLITAPANTESVVGTQRKEAQGPKWFLGISPRCLTSSNYAITTSYDGAFSRGD